MLGILFHGGELIPSQRSTDAQRRCSAVEHAGEAEDHEVEILRRTNISLNATMNAASGEEAKGHAFRNSRRTSAISCQFPR